jgi:hypothetical protein
MVFFSAVLFAQLAPAQFHAVSFTPARFAPTVASYPIHLVYRT